MFVARCPHCSAELDVDDADRGHRVSCPACRATFRAEPDAPPEPAPPPPVTAARRAPAARKWDDDSDYVNDTAVPPRHWLDREDDRGPDPLRLVRRMLAWPANGLIWTGWIGFLVLIVGGFVTAITGYFDMHSPYARGLRPIIFLSVGAVAATLGSMYFAMIATGGGQMKAVRKRGQAINTAIMGIATLLTCTPLFPLAWAGAGFGIWALVVLSRPEVVEAFERRKTKKRS